uniref:Reverse transcriptase domain-containing protein n=1 Tax=Arion vulgaris TaxID=1028688 RepID=A0A0B7BNC7_9EUPU
MGRLYRKMEENINITQAGFRGNRGTCDHIFNMRTIIEKSREYNVDLYSCFIDYSKAFDCVEHQELWKIMGEMGFPLHLIQIIRELYSHQMSAVRTCDDTSDWFDIRQGVRQGCILLLCLNIC